MPRRVTRGLDTARLDTVVAVLARRAGVDIGRSDIYASSLGGLRVVEPAADLGVLLAIASAWTGHPVPADLVAYGEVGLGGEVRQVIRSGQRLAEAARLGYRGAIVPAATGDGPSGMELIPVGTVSEAVARLAQPGGARGAGVASPGWEWCALRCWRRSRGWLRGRSCAKASTACCRPTRAR